MIFDLLRIGRKNQVKTISDYKQDALVKQGREQFKKLLEKFKFKVRFYVVMMWKHTPLKIAVSLFGGLSLGFISFIVFVPRSYCDPVTKICTDYNTAIFLPILVILCGILFYLVYSSFQKR